MGQCYDLTTGGKG